MDPVTLAYGGSLGRLSSVLWRSLGTQRSEFLSESF